LTPNLEKEYGPTNESPKFEESISAILFRGKTRNTYQIFPPDSMHQ
jgi:hypothetical protein